MLTQEFKANPSSFGKGFASVEIKPKPLPNQLPYDMPPVHVGQQVLWFANCSPSSRPEPCTVQRVSHRNVLLTANNANASVPSYGIVHAGDPGVQNPNIRQNGCWDYTKWDHAMLARIDKLEHALAQIRDELGIADPDAPVPVPVETEEARQHRMAELEAAMEQDAGLSDTE
jgi:hypothetical protein